MPSLDPTPKKSAKVARFVVHGSGLTDIARNMVLSDNPSGAWRLLRDSFLEKGLEGEVTAVLEGRKKIVGDSNRGLRFVADRSSAPYRKTMGFIFAGRVRINGAWYRPADRVVRLGPEDAREASYLMPDEVDPDEAAGVIREWWKDRARQYAKSGDILVEVSDKDFYLFEPVGEPPFWLKEISDPKEAIREFLLAGQRIGEVGAMTREEESVIDTPAKRIAREEAEADEEDEELREAQFEEEKRQYGAKVREQAGTDTFELSTKSGKTYTIARAPFIRWALSRTALRHMAPEWKEVSPSGLKLQMDDPNHTDWMLGAGVDLSESYDSEIHEAALDRNFEIQREYGNFEIQVLSTAPDCVGVVGTEAGSIFVLEDLQNTPENNEAAAKACAIITQRGGQLAHLAIVAREMKIPVFRVSDATRWFPPGTKLGLYAETGRISFYP